MRIIAGTARGRTIQAPSGMNTRPTLDRVRENLFNMLQGEIAGTHVLDLFAGSGALSLEALSRGADYAVMADRDRKASQCQQDNIRALGFEDRTEVITAEWQRALNILKDRGHSFDLVFLDPPYRMNDLRDVFDGMSGILENSALIIVEHEAGKPVTVPDTFEAVKERSWGYCGVVFYRRKAGSGEEEESP